MKTALVVLAFAAALASSARLTRQEAAVKAGEAFIKKFDMNGDC